MASGGDDAIKKAALAAIEKAVKDRASSSIGRGRDFGLRKKSFEFVYLDIAKGSSDIPISEILDSFSKSGQLPPKGQLDDILKRVEDRLGALNAQFGTDLKKFFDAYSSPEDKLRFAIEIEQAMRKGINENDKGLKENIETIEKAIAAQRELERELGTKTASAAPTAPATPSPATGPVAPSPASVAAPDLTGLFAGTSSLAAATGSANPVPAASSPAAAGAAPVDAAKRQLAELRAKLEGLRKKGEDEAKTSARKIMSDRTYEDIKSAEIELDKAGKAFAAAPTIPFSAAALATSTGSPNPPPQPAPDSSQQAALTPVIPNLRDGMTKVASAYGSGAKDPSDMPSNPSRSARQPDRPLHAPVDQGNLNSPVTEPRLKQLYDNFKNISSYVVEPIAADLNSPHIASFDVFQRGAQNQQGKKIATIQEEKYGDKAKRSYKLGVPVELQSSVEFLQNLARSGEKELTLSKPGNLRDSLMIFKASSYAGTLDVHIPPEVEKKFLADPEIRGEYLKIKEDVKKKGSNQFTPNQDNQPDDEGPTLTRPPSSPV